MDTDVHLDNQRLIELRADFVGHRIFRAVRSDGRPGEWVATLRDSKAGVDPTVMRGEAEELRAALVEEAQRAKREREMFW